MSLSVSLSHLSATCPSFQFPCGSSKASSNETLQSSPAPMSAEVICIDRKFHCDSKIDCPNGEDEENCGQYISVWHTFYLSVLTLWWTEKERETFVSLEHPVSGHFHSPQVLWVWWEWHYLLPSFLIHFSLSPLPIYTMTQSSVANEWNIPDDISRIVVNYYQMVQEKLKTTPVNPILTSEDDIIETSASDISWSPSTYMESSTGYYYDSSYDVTGTEATVIESSPNISCRELTTMSTELQPLINYICQWLPMVAVAIWSTSILSYVKTNPSQRYPWTWKAASKP